MYFSMSASCFLYMLTDQLIYLCSCEHIYICIYLYIIVDSNPAFSVCLPVPNWIVIARGTVVSTFIVHFPWYYMVFIPIMPSTIPFSTNTNPYPLITTYVCSFYII